MNLNKHKIGIALSSASILATLLVFSGLGSASATQPQGKQICAADSRFEVRELSGQNQTNFCDVTRDQVVLVVNTASRCAYTDQYEGLEQLYSQYRDQGFMVAGFPSNDFGNQEPGREDEIKTFCRVTWGVRFPMFGKTRVRGDDAAPLYQALTRISGDPPRWNFHKYLIDRQGQVVASFGSSTEPDSPRLVSAIEELL